MAELIDISADFETYYDSDYSLKKMTTMEYIHSPLFEVIMLSIGPVNGPGKMYFGPEEVANAVHQIDWSRVNLIAHRAAFDAAILAWVFGAHPAKISCTMAMAMPFHSGSVSLDALATYYNLPAKGTAVHNMLGKRLADMSPADRASYGDYCGHDRVLCGSLYNIFKPRLPARELSTIDATIRMYTDPKLRIDQSIIVPHLRDLNKAQELCLDEVALMLEAYNLLPPSVAVPKIKPGETPTEARRAAMKAHCSSTPKFCQLLEALGETPPTKLNKKGLLIPALAKTDAGMEALLEHEDPSISLLAEARLSAKSTLPTTRAERFLTLATHGALPFPLTYFGARQTGRWSAWDSINMQNLPRKSPLRDALTAPEGYQVLSGDLSQVELRTGLCLASQFDKLQALAGGHDLYKQSVTDALGVPYYEVNDEQRQVGKVTQLSAIFGVSARVIRRTIWLMARVRIDEPTAELVHATYRKTHPHVVRAWREGDTALQMIANGMEGPIWGGQCHVVKGGIRKPSGLVVRFPGLRQQVGDAGRLEWIYLKSMGRSQVPTKIYGAKVFQNVVQSIARDAMAAIVARINDARKKPPFVQPVGLIHDELIGIVPTPMAQLGARLLYAAMTTPIKFCAGIPLACEIYLGDAYGTSKKWNPEPQST
jgi:hypothetical protein